MNNIVVIFAFSCGIVAATPTSLSNRIIGGQDAPDGAFPYIGSLRRSDHTHVGSGNIISDSWILTTAVTAVFGNPSMIVVGTTQLSPHGTAYEISDIILHPNLGIFPLHDDIALIKLYGKISFSPNVKPIELPNAPPANGTAVTVAGWGYTNLENKTTPDKLQYINVTLIDSESCKDKSNTTICTIGPPGKGVCYFDNGAPVATNNVLFGLASWMFPCALGQPDGHTNVALYRDWIRKTTGV